MDGFGSAIVLLLGWGFVLFILLYILFAAYEAMQDLGISYLEALIYTVTYYLGRNG